MQEKPNIPDMNRIVFDLTGSLAADSYNYWPIIAVSTIPLVFFSGVVVSMICADKLKHHSSCASFLQKGGILLIGATVSVYSGLTLSTVLQDTDFMNALVKNALIGNPDIKNILKNVYLSSFLCVPYSAVFAIAIWVTFLCRGMLDNICCIIFTIIILLMIPGTAVGIYAVLLDSYSDDTFIRTLVEKAMQEYSSEQILEHVIQGAIGFAISTLFFILTIYLQCIFSYKDIERAGRNALCILSFCQKINLFAAYRQALEERRERQARINSQLDTVLKRMVIRIPCNVIDYKAYLRQELLDIFPNGYRNRDILSAVDRYAEKHELDKLFQPKARCHAQREATYIGPDNDQINNLLSDFAGGASYAGPIFGGSDLDRLREPLLRLV